MKISVTQEHIDRGKRGMCSFCPVALALRDAGFPDPFVGGFGCVITVPNEEAVWVAMPPFVRTWIKKFDFSVHTGEPFEFNLDIPDPTHA